MPTRIAILVLAGFLAIPANAQEKTYTIKLRGEEQGDRIKVTKSFSSTVIKTTTVKNETTVKEEITDEKLVYIEEFLQRPANAKHPTKLTRAYEISSSNQSGVKKTSRYVGKTVVIEMKGDNYVFTVDGKELSEEDAEDIDSDFNERVETLADELLLPKKPVKVNESWNVDLAKFIDEFEMETGIAVDLAKSKLTGKLSKAYMKDGHQFGVLEFAFDFKMKSNNADKEVALVKPGAKLVYAIVRDVCIDGTARAGKESLGWKLEMVSEGTGGTDAVKLDVKGVTTWEPVEKK